MEKDYKMLYEQTLESLKFAEEESIRKQGLIDEANAKITGLEAEKQKLEETLQEMAIQYKGLLVEVYNDVNYGIQTLNRIKRLIPFKEE